jgi:hypothetical protein
MGLFGWSPAGLSPSMIELIDVSTGMPCSDAIALLSGLQVLLLFFSIKQLRNFTVPSPYQPHPESAVFPSWLLIVVVLFIFMFFQALG